jgi:hypothetical protein
MYTMTTQTDEKADVDEVELWEVPGEPLHLARNFGDLWIGGQLGMRVVLPARHVHPKVRAAAEAVQAAERDRAAIDSELVALNDEREMLMRDLAKVRPGPESVAAKQRLRDIVLDVEIARDFRIPELDRAIQLRWDELHAAVVASWEEWRSYLHRRAAIAVEALQSGEGSYTGGALAPVLFWLDDLRQIDSLLALEGVFRQEAGPATFQRSLRSASLQRIVAGADLGDQGEQYGIVPLVLQYRSAIASASS